MSCLHSCKYDHKYDFFFSLYWLPICSNILYCFLNHKQHWGRKKVLVLLFISAWQMKTCGGGDQTGREGFFPFTLILLFQGTLFFFLVLVCILIQPMNIHMICNVLEKMKLCLKKSVWEFKISLRREHYFSIDSDYWWKHLTHSYWTYFSSGNASYFYLEDVKTGT